MFARHFIDSADFARNGGELRGAVPVSEMPRLQDLLAAPDGEISFFVRGLPGENGRPMLEITVSGSCQLRCQRCLEGFNYPINLAQRLLLGQAGELDDFADDGSDTADSIVADQHMDVLNMIEEEILLGLPFAPKHPPGACQMAGSGLNHAAASPFAALAGLKNRQS